MKKLVSLALAAVLAVSAVGCGSSSDSQAALLTAHRALKQQLMEQPLRLVESDRSPEELQSMARLL